MKKLLILASIVAIIFVFANCNSAKKSAGATVAAVKSTYEANVQTTIMANCVPCHIPAKGGNKKAYDTFASVKGDIDEIIRRIELNPGERGFMPFKKSTKLSDSTIAIFKKWRDDGMMEK
ncbi:MAG: hypothetical protein ABIT05_09935 [Chitinophagaceae bacterium]